MISKWHMKAIVQKGISYMPKKEQINYWFQKNITKGVELTDEYFGYKITHAKDHLKFFEKHLNKKINDCSVLELGTGWYPIVPIALYLNDVKKVYTIDLSDWMTLDNLITTFKKFVEWEEEGKLKKYLSKINHDKWRYIKILSNKRDDDISLSKICKGLNLNRLIGDARQLDFSDNSIDLICSNNTFEHIPKEILIGILKEFKRVIKEGGVMTHFIDMSDHFAHFDKSINIYNFLKFSDRVWSVIDNSIQPQNRFRLKDYMDIYKQLEIPVTDKEYTEGDIEELMKIALDRKYKSYSDQELAISHVYLISKM